MHPGRQVAYCVLGKHDGILADQLSNNIKNCRAFSEKNNWEFYLAGGPYPKCMAITPASIVEDLEMFTKSDVTDLQFIYVGNGSSQAISLPDGTEIHAKDFCATFLRGLKLESVTFHLFTCFAQEWWKEFHASYVQQGLAQPRVSQGSDCPTYVGFCHGFAVQFVRPAAK